MEGHYMQSRRTFLKGAGVAAAAAATFAIAGCASPGKETTDAVKWKEEYDVIVVGAGLAGLAAAVTVATEGNGAKCLLLEKDTMPNGNSPFCQGSTLFTETPDKLLPYLKALSGGATPDDVLAAFADGLKDNFEWIKSLGANESDINVSPASPANRTEYPEFNIGESYKMITFTGQGGGHKHIHAFLLDVINKYSDVITYKTSTPLEALVQDNATGAVLGVMADGASYKANKGVIMCCGGFESSEEMLATYHGVKGVKPLAAKANTGDGHMACMNAGADQWHMTAGAQYWMAARNIENTKHISNIWHYSNKKWGITVGANGRRFYQDCDGCAVPSPYEAPYAEAGADLTRGVGYRHGITQFGGNWTHLPFPEKGWLVFDAQGLAKGGLPPELTKDPVADGWTYSANSIEELAAAIKVPADELTKTVAIWNEFCDAGEDKAFYRPADTLNKVAEPPFYAMLCVPTMLNTDGGPVRSAAGEILNPMGKPIPGLYSAGEFGSVWGHLYQGAGNLGECLAFGRISVRSALAAKGAEPEKK